jgi:hypothetical protein
MITVEIMNEVTLEALAHIPKPFASLLRTAGQRETPTGENGSLSGGKTRFTRMKEEEQAQPQLL